MKILILNTDYSAFLNTLYAQNPGIAAESYDVQQKVRMDSLFGVADYYSSNLRKLGNEVFDIHVNNKALQMAWAKEHGLKIALDFGWSFCWRNRIVPWVTRKKRNYWELEILAAQIRYYKPDVVLNQAMDCIPSKFLFEMKPYIRFLVGQHAATCLPESEDLGAYDLCISSFPPMVDWFRSKGLKAELNRLGFEPRILHFLKEVPHTIPISFIGSFQVIHSTRTEWLEQLCSKLEVDVWTPDLDRLPSESTIRKSYKGAVWGAEMYQVLHDSRITLNHHGNIPPYANNMRLYEATGVGTLLITDWKQNLQEMFEIGKEVVAYRSTEECLELIDHYLSHPDEAIAIARAGQQKTLTEHTYARRMEEFIGIVRKMM